jgi:hypothetical protein
MLTLVTPRERYSIDAEGNIGRPEITMKPSGQWKAIGLVRVNNFGNPVEYIPFSRFAEIAADPNFKWCHKNGKTRWHLRDRDHGTLREWWGNGQGVIGLYHD